MLDDPTRLLGASPFTAAEVQAGADVSGPTLNNMVNKSAIELCTPPPGQGRARKFCLVDVYNVALVAELGALSGKPTWAASALSDRLFCGTEIGQFVIDKGLPAFGPGLSVDKESLSAFKSALCNDPLIIPKFYTHRQWRAPYIAVIGRTDIVPQPYEGAPEPGGWIQFLPAETFIGNLGCASSGIYIDVTRLFAKVDERLLRLESVKSRLTPGQ